MEKTSTASMKEYVKDYSFPTDILIETIARCNLKCGMCPSPTLKRPRGQMSPQLWKKIIDELAGKSPETTVWPTIIGEPLLLGKQIFENVRYAKNAGIKNICLNSNFMLFNSHLAEPLFESGLDELIIGLDAITQFTYEKIRIGGDFNRVMKNIELLMDEAGRRNSSLKVTIQMVLQEDNWHEEQEFIDYWQKKALGITVKLRHRVSWGGSVSHSTVLDVEEDRIPCLWLLRQMSVLWNGMVPKCDSPNETYHGDLNHQSISDVWNGELRELRASHSNLDFNMSPCNHCKDWQVGRSKTIIT